MGERKEVEVETKVELCHGCGAVLPRLVVGHPVEGTESAAMYRLAEAAIAYVDGLEYGGDLGALIAARVAVEAFEAPDAD